MKRKPRIGRFLAALALKPGTKGAIRDSNLSADAVAHVAKLTYEAESARHGKKRSKGGLKSAKPGRAVVERVFRSALLRRANPRDYFPDLANQHDYSPRQLANILKAVESEDPGGSIQDADKAEQSEATISPELVQWLYAKAGKKKKAKKTLK